MIEAEPNNFASALRRRRNVRLVPACLSLTTKPQLVPFVIGREAIGKIDKTRSATSVLVQCVPLYSILLAINKTTIDLFSLDIEGNELDVLKTLPYDKVDIKV
jgi:Methyltransferase FkbM domain